MTKEQIKIKVNERIKEGSVFSRVELIREYTRRYASSNRANIPVKSKKTIKKSKKSTIAFLDFEFGQIYGSYRRDFLVTEVAVLIYDKKSNKLELGEIIFNPNIDLVLRGRVENIHGEYKEIEKIINPYKKEFYKYDKNFKITKVEQKKLRQEWNNKFINKLRNFLNHSLSTVEKIYLFGGNEDINILNRYKIKLNNIIDIQTILQKNDKNQYSFKIQEKLKIDSGKRYSLDLLIDRLEFNNVIKNKKIEFSKFSYKLPSKKGLFTYKNNNLKAHSAAGDCLRLFYVYKELIEGFSCFIEQKKKTHVS